MIMMIMMIMMMMMMMTMMTMMMMMMMVVLVVVVVVMMMTHSSFLLGIANYVSATPCSSESQHFTKQRGCSQDGLKLYTSNEFRYT